MDLQEMLWALNVDIRIGFHPLVPSSAIFSMSALSLAFRMSLTMRLLNIGVDVCWYWKLVFVNFVFAFSQNYDFMYSVLLN